MTNRRLVTLILLALIGYAGLFLLFRKTNPGARWDIELDRAAAIERVKTAAPSYGYTAPVQTEAVTIEYHRDDEYYLSRQAHPLLNSIFTPLKVQVRLADAKSGLGFEARLNSRGEWLGYRLRERPEKKDGEKKDGEKKDGEKKDGEKKDAPQPAPSPDALANDQKIADQALKKFLGERYDKFAFLSGPTSGEQDRKFSWKAADDGLNVLADVVVRNGKVREIWLQSNLTPKFVVESKARRSAALVALSATNNLLIWPAIILMIIFYFFSLARRQIDHRKTLVFLACSFPLLLMTNLFGSFADKTVLNVNFNGNPVAFSGGPAIRLAILVAINLCMAAALCLFMAPGLALSAGVAARGTIDMELLLKGKLLRRPVTGSLVAGLLIGGLLAMIVHAVAAIGFFAGASINAGGWEDTFAARAPAVDALFDNDQFLIFMSFAFLIPAAEAFVKRAWIQRVLVFVIVFFTIAGLEPFHTSAPALAVATLLQAWLLVWVYRKFGLLAVMVTIMA